MAPVAGISARERAEKQLLNSQKSLLKYKRAELQRVIRDDDGLVKDLYDQMERQGVFARQTAGRSLAITNGEIGSSTGPGRQTALNKLDQLLDS
eukprot:1950792-Amphidinium_carterae.1